MPGLSIRLAFISFSLLLALLPGMARAEAVAHVESLEGTVSVAHEGNPEHLLIKGSLLENGDIVITQQDSHALLIFADQSKVAVRPDSRLQIENFVFKQNQPDEDSFAMRLLRGGLRQLTGMISRNKSTYQLKVKTATIGIRGTDFIARLCDGLGCTADQLQSEQNHDLISPASRTAGKVVWLQGSMVARAADSSEHKLEVGSPVFEGDVLITDADGSAGFVMQDKTKLVLPKNSRLKLTAFKFVAAKADESSEVIDLLKGGLRVVTGLLGKLHGDRVQYRAATATIGIRGTSFDLVCADTGNIPGLCSGNDANVFVLMRDGEIDFGQGNDTIVLGRGKTASIKQGGAPQILPSPPAGLLDPETPKPEDLPVDFVKRFGLEKTDVADGVYVGVMSGEVLDENAGKQIPLQRGESGFVEDGLAPVRLAEMPGFLEYDPVLARYDFEQELMCTR